MLACRPMSSAPCAPRLASVALLILFVLTLAPPAVGDDEPLTLAAALAEARGANASLPMPALDVNIAESRRLEAEAERRAHFSLEGDVLYAPESSYDVAKTNVGDERVQLVARRTLLDGGAKTAALQRAAAD